MQTMKRIWAGMAALALALSSTLCAGEVTKVKAADMYIPKIPTYRLAPPDVIEVTVRGEPDLTRRVQIRPDGMIAYPLIGELKVEGLTPLEAAREMARRLSEFVRDVHLTVSVVGFNSQRIFVLGEVSRPGQYPFTGDLNVLEAVTLAGSYTRRAALGRVLVVRGDEENPIVVKVNLKKVVYKGDEKENVHLQEGDVVVVPDDVLAKTGYALEKVFFPLSQLIGVTGTVSGLNSLTNRGD